jgi:hypothetical protein
MLVMVRQRWQIDLEDLGTPWVKKTTALGRGWRRCLTPSIPGELLGFSDLGWSGVMRCKAGTWEPRERKEERCHGEGRIVGRLPPVEVR